MRFGLPIKPSVFFGAPTKPRVADRLIHLAFRNAYYTMRFGAYTKCDSYCHRAALMFQNLRRGVYTKSCVSERLLNHAFSVRLLSRAFPDCLINRAFLNAYYAVRFGVYARCNSYFHRAALVGPNLRFGATIKPCVPVNLSLSSAAFAALDPFASASTI